MAKRRLREAAGLLAMYHIERGKHSYNEYAQALVGRFGDDIRPYLKMIYSAIRDDPDFEDAIHMDSHETVNLVAKEWETSSKANERGHDDEKPSNDEDEPARLSRLQTGAAKQVANHLASGACFHDTRAALDFMGEVLGETITPNTPEAKRAEETIETGVVMAGRRIAAEAESLVEAENPADIFDALSEVYDRQPRLGTRTGDSSAHQAYSTPIHIAYAASVLANADIADVVLEPTAGHGALLVATDPGKQTVVVNEIDSVGADSLRAQGFNATMCDPADPEFYRNVPDVDSVIAHLSFGRVIDHETNTPRQWVIEDQLSEATFRTNQIDHAIATYALGRMKDDGRAVLIVGRLCPQETDWVTSVKAMRQFYWRLYSNYNVVDHFTLPGELYENMGMIIVEGRGASSLPTPLESPPPIVDLEQLRGTLIRHIRRRNRTMPKYEIKIVFGGWDSLDERLRVRLKELLMEEEDCRGAVHDLLEMVYWGGKEAYPEDLLGSLFQIEPPLRVAEELFSPLNDSLETLLEPFRHMEKADPMTLRRLIPDMATLHQLILRAGYCRE